MSYAAMICLVGGGGAAIVLLACVSFWAANAIVKQFAEQTQARFREHLAREVEAAVRTFRDGLCEQIVQQGKKSDALAGLYSTLIETLRLGKELAACCIKGDPAQIERCLRSVGERCAVFFEMYQKESLHLPEEFCAALDAFGAEQKEAMYAMERELYKRESPERKEADAEIRQHWLRLEDRIAAVMDLVRKEFHRRTQTPGNFILQGLQEVPAAKIIMRSETKG